MRLEQPLDGVAWGSNLSTNDGAAAPERAGRGGGGGEHDAIDAHGD